MRHAASDVDDHLQGLGWPATSGPPGRTLPTKQGIVGLIMSASLASKVADEMPAGPIIGLPGAPQRWIFLVETPAGPCPELPIGVGVLNGLSRIPVPPTEGTCWIREPETSQVPSFTALLRVIRNVVCSAAAVWYADPSTTPEQRQALVDRLRGKNRTT